MRTCRYCGKENQEDAALCAICGFDLTPPAPKLKPVPSQARERGTGFFRWRTVSVILIVFTVVYGLFAPLNFWLAGQLSQRGDELKSRFLYWAAFWNIVIAVFCFVARRLIRHRTRAYLLTGAYAVAAALVIETRIWAGGLLHRRNPFPVSEAIFTLLPMLYVIIYALLESKRSNSSASSGAASL